MPHTSQQLPRYRDRSAAARTSLAAPVVSQNAQARSTQLAGDKKSRQELYRAFIEEASQHYAAALASNKTEIADLVALYFMVNRMRILSSPAVVEAADSVIRLIVHTSFEPGKTLVDLRKTLESPHIDPLMQFSEACREDLQRGCGWPVIRSNAPICAIAGAPPTPRAQSNTIDEPVFPDLH